MRRPGASRSHLGGILGALGAILEANWGQKAPKRVPKRGPKRGPKVIRAENGKITKVYHSTQDLLDFSGPGLPFCVQNGVPKRGPNRSIEVEGVREPLEWLLERSWRLPGPKISAQDPLLRGPRRAEQRRATPTDANRLSLWGGRPHLKNLVSLGSIIIGSLDHRIIGSLSRIVCPGSDTP